MPSISTPVLIGSAFTVSAVFMMPRVRMFSTFISADPVFKEIEIGFAGELEEG